MAYLAPRLTAGSLAEMAAVSACQDQATCPDCRPLPLLLKDIAQKGVVVERRTPNEPVAVFDLTPVPTDDAKAVFWCAMTEEVAQSEGVWSLNAHVRAVLDHFNGLHPTITTCTDARNAPQLEWLKRLGFIPGAVIDAFGTAKLPFITFTREKVPAHV